MVYRKLHNNLVHNQYIFFDPSNMNIQEKKSSKAMFVGSKAEEYAHRINCHHQNRLDLKIRHYQMQRDVLLKSFRIERSAILQRKGEIDRRLEELHRTRQVPTQEAKIFQCL